MICSAPNTVRTQVYSYGYYIVMWHCHIVNVGALTRDPENVVAEVGSTATLRCWLSSAAAIHWDHYARSNPTVYNGDMVVKPLRHRYHVNEHHQLVISDVMMSDAGNYSCYEEADKPKKVVILVVLRSKLYYLFHTYLIILF